MLKNALFLFLFAMTLTSEALANDAKANYDRVETRKDGLPRNFRDLAVFNLNAIASAEFSEAELKKVREKFKKDKIIIVDLRRESHVLLNGLSVSFDETNNDSKISEILSAEREKVSAIKKNPQLELSALKPELKKLESIKTEEELAKENGFEYKRFAIKDRNIPDQKQFDEMVEFIKNLPKDKKLYVHCAAGKGRTTTFLVIYDIIKNGKEVALAEIFKRQEAIGGARLDQVNDEISGNKELMEKRLMMFKKLYDSRS